MCKKLSFTEILINSKLLGKKLSSLPVVMRQKVSGILIF